MKLKPRFATTCTALAFSVTCSLAPTASADELRCGSGPGTNNYCHVDTSQGVDLLVQHSGYPCYYNDTWGYDRAGIWVANGCSATFRVGNDKPKGGDKTAAAVGLGILALAILGAASDDEHPDDRNPSPPHSNNYAGGQNYGNKSGYNQGSGPNYGPAPGSSYGSPPGGSAEQSGNYGQGNSYGSGQYANNQRDDEEDYVLISCNSKNKKLRTCPIRIRGHAELIRQRSSSACRFNKSWGYDPHGVWVSKGCRGDFAVYD